MTTNSSKWTVPSRKDPKLGKQPSKAARQRVRDAFDADTLRDICVRNDFSQWAERTELTSGRHGQDRFYWHADNGSKILAVAHLDHVQDDGYCQVTDTAAGLLATSGALDDRLGAYVILDLLPKLGMPVDLLLTTDEEMGASTAREFHTDKQYNWMIEFDRGGTDVVAYQYETEQLCTLVEASGARMGVGSYSDIADLDSLGCVGLNWGVGYADYHSSRSHAWLDDTFRMVARFGKFYKANAATLLPYHYDAKGDESWWNSLDDPDDYDFVDAESWVEADCGHEINVLDEATFVEMHGVVICSGCNTKLAAS